jgi:hypothetical protein
MADIFGLMVMALGFRVAKLILQITILGIPILMMVSMIKMLRSLFKPNESEEILRNRSQLIRKHTECNYLRELLNKNGIEWESGWRQIQ